MLASHFSNYVCHAVLRLLCFYKFSISCYYLALVLIVMIYVALHHVAIYPVFSIRLIHVVLNSKVIFIKADRFELITSFEGFGQQVEHVVT